MRSFSLSSRKETKSAESDDDDKETLAAIISEESRVGPSKDQPAQRKAYKQHGYFSDEEELV